MLATKACGLTHLHLEDAPDAVDTDQHQIPFGFVVFLEKLDKNVQPATAYKHLQGEGAGLIHLAHESCSLEPDVAAVSLAGEAGDDRDATYEAQVLLNLNIVQDDEIHNLQ